MKPTLPSHLWITRYCQRALQQRPELAQSSVIRRAVAAYPYASGMSPEAAAELYSSLSELRERTSDGLRRRFDGTRSMSTLQTGTY